MSKSRASEQTSRTSCSSTGRSGNSRSVPTSLIFLQLPDQSPSVENEPIKLVTKLHSRGLGINLHKPLTNAVVYILPGRAAGTILMMPRWVSERRSGPPLNGPSRHTNLCSKATMLSGLAEATPQQCLTSSTKDSRSSTVSTRLGQNNRHATCDGGKKSRRISEV